MSKPFIADFKPVETLSNFSGSSKYVTDSTIAFARLAGSSDLKIPEPVSYTHLTLPTKA